jgi:hypothetical protein
MKISAHFISALALRSSGGPANHTNDANGVLIDNADALRNHSVISVICVIRGQMIPKE